MNAYEFYQKARTFAFSDRQPLFGSDQNFCNGLDSGSMEGLRTDNKVVAESGERT
jgi:hypothetical protein